MDGRTDGQTGGFYFFNVENSIKREIRKNLFFYKKNSTPPPPPPPRRNFLFFNVGNSMKRLENMKYWKKKLKFYFFQYLKNS